MKNGVLHELPEGWVCTRLENCIEVLDRQRIPINAKERDKRIVNKAISELYPYYGATGQVGWIDDYLFDEDLILLGEDGAPFFDSTKNKAYIIKGKSWVNNHAHVLKALSSIALNKFLCHYLNIFDYRGYVTGTTRYKLNQLSMRNFPILLPPLPEQRAIVSKIEQLFSDLDNGIDNFKKAQAQLKLYRQSILKAACEGKLVPTEAELAQAEGRDYEAADVLLERILEERREKRNGKGKYKEAPAPDTSGLSELPEGWMWTQTGDICEGVVPGRTKPKEFKGEIPWITLPDIRSLYISKSQKNLSVTKEDAEKVGMKIMPKGSVLISCVGQFGIICIAGCQVVPNQQFHGFICPDVIIPEYVAYSLMIQIEQMNKLSTATTIAYINKTKCNSIIIPLPPLAEQRRIVAEVERRLSVCDKMEETITESLEKAEALRQSILKKAFEGKLLNERELEEARNAPDWEPAEKLLDRIRREKQIKENNNKFAKGKSKE